mgnify:CR=1 FL=1
MIDVSTLQFRTTINSLDIEVYEPVIILKPDLVFLGQRVRVDSFTKIEGGRGVRIGAFTHVASFAHLNIGGGELEIGQYCGIASGVRVITG